MIAARFSVCIFATFALIGVYLPFLPAFLAGRGLAHEQIATVLAVAMWCQFPVGLGLAALAEKSGRRRRIIVLGNGVVLLALASFVLLNGYPALLLGWLVVGTLLSGGIPLLDSMATLPSNLRRFNYGQVRLWGSVGFIVASTGGGLYLDGRGAESVLALLIGAAALLWAATLALPEAAPASRPAGRFAVLELLRDRAFVTFVGCAALLQASHAALYGFATLRWLDAGIGERVIGLLWAEGVVAEVALFTLGHRLLRRLSVPAIFGLAALAGMLRWLLLGMSTEIAVLALGQALHALTFAATHLAAVTFIARTVDSSRTATAQVLYNGLAMGLVFGCAMLAAGFAYEREPRYAFFAMAGLSLAGGLGALLLRRQLREADG